MIKDHESCRAPSNLNVRIWRYMSFSKFVDLIVNETLFFSRCDRFDDNLEGLMSRKAYIERFEEIQKYSKSATDLELNQKRLLSDFDTERIKSFAANCWHMNDHESDAMWKIFLNNQEGIAVQSTYYRLYDCLNNTTDPVYLSIVEYFDPSGESKWDWGTYLRRILHKRHFYEHENELRAVILSDDGYDFNDSGASIKVDINILIENIFISPSAPKWIFELVNKLIENFQYKFNVEKSRQDYNPNQ